MAGVFQNIDPPPPSPPPLWCGGRTHSLGMERGWGVNILEDARHSSVLYIRKYFVDRKKQRVDCPTKCIFKDVSDSFHPSPTQTRYQSSGVLLHKVPRLETLCNDTSRYKRLRAIRPTADGTFVIIPLVLVLWYAVHVLKPQCFLTSHVLLCQCPMFSTSQCSIHPRY